MNLGDFVLDHHASFISIMSVYRPSVTNFIYLCLYNVYIKHGTLHARKMRDFL